jgi:hypothetical protein
MYGDYASCLGLGSIAFSMRMICIESGNFANCSGDLNATRPTVELDSRVLSPWNRTTWAINLRGHSHDQLDFFSLPYRRGTSGGIH